MSAWYNIVCHPMTANTRFFAAMRALGSLPSSKMSDSRRWATISSMLTETAAVIYWDTSCHTVENEPIQLSSIFGS